MKQLLVAAFFLLPSTFVLSQNYSIQEVDQPPKIENECKDNNSPKCFESSILKYANQNINIMKLINGGEGTAYVQFIITAEGDITNIKTRANSKPLEKEAKRLVKKIRISKPAIKDGKSVAVIYTLPVKFQKKNFDNYDEFIHTELSNKDFVNLSDVTIPPEIENCDADKECLKTQFRMEIIGKLKQQNFDTSELSKLKLTFVITKESEIDNIVVIVPNKKLEIAVRSILKNIKVIKPALNKNEEAVSVRINYQFENI